MNALQKFFQDGLNDQLFTAGDTVTLTNPKTKEKSEFVAVLTETSGNTTVEIGDILIVVNAHILIPQTYNPKVGYTITHNNFDYKIVSLVKSPYEVAYDCQLVKI